MTISDIAISRNLAAAGFDKPKAEAIAEAISLQADERFATKADIARLEGKMDAQFAEVKMQIKLILAINCGLFIGITLLILDRLAG